MFYGWPGGPGDDHAVASASSVLRLVDRVRVPEFFVAMSFLRVKRTVPRKVDNFLGRGCSGVSRNTDKEGFVCRRSN